LIYVNDKYSHLKPSFKTSKPPVNVVLILESLPTTYGMTQNTTQDLHLGENTQWKVGKARKEIKRTIGISSGRNSNARVNFRGIVLCGALLRMKE
jgi:hypothetical protein